MRIPLFKVVFPAVATHTHTHTAHPQQTQTRGVLRVLLTLEITVNSQGAPLVSGGVPRRPPAWHTRGNAFWFYLWPFGFSTCDPSYSLFARDAPPQYNTASWGISIFVPCHLVTLWRWILYFEDSACGAPPSRNRVLSRDHMGRSLAEAVAPVSSVSPCVHIEGPLCLPRGLICFSTFCAAVRLVVPCVWQSAVHCDCPLTPPSAKTSRILPSLPSPGACTMAHVFTRRPLRVGHVYSGSAASWHSAEACLSRLEIRRQKPHVNSSGHALISAHRPSGCRILKCTNAVASRPPAAV